MLPSLSFSPFLSAWSVHVFVGVVSPTVTGTRFPSSARMALTQSSRLISNIATSLLYHTVSLSAAAKMNSFLHTMKQRSESSALLSRYVRQFSIHEGPDLLIPVAHLDSEPLDPILLPNLKEYFGPSSFTSSFDLTSGSVSQVSLLWHPGDLLETPFSHLSKIASLQTFSGISTSADIGDSDILASAATHLPHIQTLEIRGMEDVAARISPEDTLQIAVHLEKFTALSVLELGSFNDGEANNPNIGHETILLWSRACKSLA
ncbi:hypothetical protein B0H14DRAFT_2574399 [Mycena olivaceomarginata]|nr:hypothetical protein B0H14DRAFT_2574399 [Mycena olivaceomarginata]